MPELPEVEVTRLSFASRIAGAQIMNVAMGKALRWPLGCAPQGLQGLHVLGVRRRGKYLLMDLSQGLLLIHLGMSGSLSFGEALSPPGPHDHFNCLTDKGLLRLHDPRRFGAVVYAASQPEKPLSSSYCWQVMWWSVLAIFTPAKRFSGQGFAPPRGPIASANPGL